MKALAAIGGLLALRGVSFGQNDAMKNGRIANSWFYQGQPCAIFQQGSMLLLINEAGSVGSGIWTGNNTFTVLGGSGWAAGLNAEISNHGRTINWSNATVWKQGANSRRTPRVEGGWIYSGQPCAIFQRENLLVLVNESGYIGSGLIAPNNVLAILGGAGWDIGLTAQVSGGGNVLDWSNSTIWTRA